MAATSYYGINTYKKKPFPGGKKPYYQQQQQPQGGEEGMEMAPDQFEGEVQGGEQQQ
jgi:hypothetical protein